MATKPSDTNPYVGLRPFRSNEQNRFFGRGREANELLALIMAHPIVLIYAQSGTGKTSLINAGLMPLLEKEGFEVFPPARVQGRIPKNIQLAQIPNPYALNTLISWAEEEANPEALLNLSLARFLKGHPRLIGGLGMPAARVAVLDQFEELLTFYQERWRDREDFFKQVRDALEVDPLLRVVLVIREDYIAQLDPYAAFLPEKLRIRFRLERLREPAALAAVTGPLAGSERRFADGVAEALVRDLMKIQVMTATGDTETIAGEFVEPVQLQVTCHNLWAKLGPGDVIITQKHVEAFGDVNQALAGFYEQSLQQAAGKAGLKEADLRAWFERHLITSAGTRGTVYRGQEQTGGIPNAAVDVLEDVHLITGEWRAGAHWYELTHDRFIEPIQQSNRRWRDLELTPRPIYMIGLVITGLWLVACLAVVILAKLYDPLGAIWSVVQHPLTVLIMVSLWAFPLAAWFWRERMRSVTEASRTFLDPAPQSPALPRQTPLHLGRAFASGLVGGVGYCGLLLAIRIVLRLTVPEAQRSSDDFILNFFLGTIVLTALVQVVVAVVGAVWVKRLGWVHGLFAAFVAGCVMTVGILGLNLLFGGTLDPTFVWNVFSQVVNEGALLALPFVLIVSALSGRLRAPDLNSDQGSNPSVLGG